MILREPEIGGVVNERIDFVVADVHSQRGQRAHLIQVVKVKVVHRVVGQVNVLHLGQILRREGRERERKG